MLLSKFFLVVGEMWLVVVVIVAGLFVCLKRLTLGCSPVPVATGLVFDVCRG